jgi:predicted ATPase
MKKQIAFSLVLVLIVSLFAGCAGTAVVYYGECTCPTAPSTLAPTDPVNPPAEGAVKTGLAIVTSVSKSINATCAEYDVTLVAVTVDDKGVIEQCIIDSIGAKVEFDATGALTKVPESIATKNELGDSYGMVAWGGAKYEWYQQAAALADYAEGKTVAQLKDGAIEQTGYAPDGTDLAASATIYLGGYVSAIEVAVNNAKHLGAIAGDELRLASLSSAASSAAATADKAGNAQLDVDVTAVTVNNGKITSCYIDSVQAKVAFDATGTISSDITAPVKTKNELGESYGMVAWGSAKYEWNVQAANFAAYVTGKTAAEVAGIAVNEGTKPTDVDLSAGVTIAIGGFQALIAKVFA